MTIDLSIIIVNWNVRDLLRECLRSTLEDGGILPGRLELVVVDNDSRDGSVEMVRAEFPQLPLIANRENVGFGRANNQALPLCHGRHVLLLNPDTRVLPGALAALVRHMDETPDAAVMGCRLLNADGSLQRWTGGAYPRLLNVVNHYFFVDRLLPSGWRPLPLYLDRDVAHDIDVDWVSGAAMILRADRLDGRLFDPHYFMYGEDMELCHRLKAAGGRVVYTPVASIVHYQGESMKQQDADVMLSSLKGPRQFYKHVRGDRGVLAYDLVTVAGFGLRALLYGGAALARGGDARLAAKARSSRDLMGRAWRILRS
ncbi:MAG: glycosyltransferase family 2 protein [Burkholderiaceae bacterium]